MSWCPYCQATRPDDCAYPEHAGKVDGCLLDAGLRIVTLDAFADEDEDGAAALLGADGNAVIPEGGDIAIYGDAGVGKTTLAIDLAFHLAAGDDWLGITVANPLRVLLIENEGPRPFYRQKLARKRDAWAGSPLEDRIRVFEHPWGRVNFADPEWRQRLADEIRAEEIDIVIAGPVTSLGMDAPGTIQEVRAFNALFDQTRALSGRRISFALVHHENRAGKPSGAWEGVGDTLLHITQQGHGHLRLHFQKARWASAHHQTTLQLVWADGETFRIDEQPELDDEMIAERLLAAIKSNPGIGWTRVEEQTPGVARDRRRGVRDQLLHDGVIVNVGKGEDGLEVALDHCPERKTARLYPAEDPTIRHLRRDPGAAAAQTAPPRGELAGAHLRRAPRPIGGAGVGAPDSPPSRDTRTPDLDDEVERLAALAREAQHDAGEGPAGRSTT